MVSSFDVVPTTLVAALPDRLRLAYRGVAEIA